MRNFLVPRQFSRARAGLQVPLSDSAGHLSTPAGQLSAPAGQLSGIAGQQNGFASLSPES